MKIKGVIIILSVLTAAAISGCLSGDKTPADPLEPRENSEAGVKIIASYLMNITDVTAFEIDVTAHSDYNDDFKNNSYLRDSSGKTYQPLSYEGERGHHAKGILRFPRVEGMKFELVIQNVAGVKERVFKW